MNVPGVKITLSCGHEYVMPAANGPVSVSDSRKCSECPADEYGNAAVRSVVNLEDMPMQVNQVVPLNDVE